MTARVVPVEAVRARFLALRRDRGVVAIVTGILFVVFLGFVGFVVDAGRWYLVKEQTQKAADAAALAGVVNLPGNLSAATTRARDYASLNGFTNAVTNNRTTRVDVVQPADRKSRLKVTVTTTVSNFFTPLFGLDSTTIAATSTADYTGPVKMGSPCNRLGADPEQASLVSSPACSATTGRLFVNVNAPGTEKQQGDPYQSTICTPTNSADNCGGSASAPNQDYRPEGYFYNITVTKSTNLDVQLFDPVWVNVGATCSNGPLTNLLPIPNILDPVDAATRFASGLTAYCTGDSFIRGGSGMGAENKGVENTTFTLRSAAGGANPLDHPVLCTKTYNGYNPTSNADFRKKLDPTVANTSYDAELAGAFRRWTSLCTVPGASAGDYILQVQSAGNVSAGNRFAIRAVGGAASDSTSLSVSGRESMGLFTNDTRSVSQFYLARVPSSASGQTLKVRFFDVGDCGEGTCTLSLQTPAGAAASGCTGEGPMSGAIPSCSFEAPSSTFNGKWQTVRIPIPSDYTCDDADATACWYRVQFSGAGASPTDVTAWTAEMDGQPVRLVQ